MPVGTARLESLAVIDIRGMDAPAFLHAQLCGDVLGLAAGRCRFTAWCSPKGRVIATLLLARGRDGFRVFLCRDIAARVRQRLGMFVLRARVELADRSEDLAIAGHRGADAVWDYTEHDGITAAALPGSGNPRRLVCGTPAQLAPLDDGMDATTWALEDVAAGLPWVGAALSEEFLPQELDLERLQGLSYSKGCYPGQEIIARVHSRGRLKRELRVFTVAAAPPAVATNIITENRVPAGRVLAAARASAESSRGLAVIERALPPGGKALHLDTPGMPLLHIDAGQH